MQRDLLDLSDSVRFVRFVGLLDLSDLSISDVKKNAQPPAGRTDRPSYRDAWTHLKSDLTFINTFATIGRVSASFILNNGRFTASPALEFLDAHHPTVC